MDFKRIWQFVILTFLLVLLPLEFCVAKVTSSTLVWTLDGKRYVGEIVYDKSGDLRKPGIVIFPEWYGINSYSRSRARQLAELGYVALAADLYGDGHEAKSAEEASQFESKLSADPIELRKRANAALEALRKFEKTDSDRVGAIGYCFGGGAAMELARCNAPVRGIVNFHGRLAAKDDRLTSDGIRPAILAFHGGQDPFIPKSDAVKFEKEMAKVQADYQLVTYGHCLHSFTIRETALSSPEEKYDAKADARSWSATQDFFNEIFSK